MNENHPHPGAQVPPGHVTSRSPARRLSVAIVVGAAAALGAGRFMLHRAQARTNDVALASAPRPVTVIQAEATTFRPVRRYVGTLRSWVEANVGPQFISAYVESVAVRPGAEVRRGDVLATLDCRSATSASNAVAMQARAIDARRAAIASEADRTRKLLDGGYASANEVEQAVSHSVAEAAQLEAQKASLARSALDVSDCVLRAPFDGEIGDRFLDPGAFARPGSSLVSVLDRRTVRFSADVPELDFAVVAPGTPLQINVDAAGTRIAGTVSRRAPHADADVRTIHFEVDLPNPDRSIPVDTTAEAFIEHGDVVPATRIPVYAATVRGSRASVFVVEGGVARARVARILGEVSGKLYVERTLPPGAEIVTEGRALLSDGDAVSARAPAPESGAGEPRR